jgi:hypothetical protein
MMEKVSCQERGAWNNKFVESRGSSFSLSGGGRHCGICSSLCSQMGTGLVTNHFW